MIVEPGTPARVSFLFGPSWGLCSSKTAAVMYVRRAETLVMLSTDKVYPGPGPSGPREK